MISNNTILVIFFIFLVILACLNSPKSNEENFNDFNISNTEKINYVFWTGGYDSTYRICELLIMYKEKVQPVYISYNLDSATDTDYWVRKNRKQEIKAMRNVRNIIYKRFPYTKNLLKKTIIINKDAKYKEYDSAFNKLGLWPRKRKIHQYGHLGKVSYMMKKPIDIGVLGIHNKSLFINFLDNNLIQETNNYKLNVNENHPLFYLKFPLYNKTKRDLCNISKQYGFDDIIKLSWSCWFPVDGTPCGKCPMCIERFHCD